MIKKLVLFVIIFIVNFAFSQNQEATIYFNDGTAMEGFGSIKKNKVYFRASLDDKADNWSYDMVKGIAFVAGQTLLKIRQKVATNYTNEHEFLYFLITLIYRQYKKIR